jgi:hypothetical protein
MQTNTLTSKRLDVVSRLTSSPLTLQAISEGEAELIHGGKHDHDRKLDRSKERPSNPWLAGKFVGQGWGNGLVINIYQINLAINTILGGAGGSIVNVQGNSSANA